MGAPRDRLALLERQDVVDVGKAVRRAGFDRIDDAFRPAAAVHAHDFSVNLPDRLVARVCNFQV